MKAIGKGSLASILAVGLHVVRIVLWIGLAGLTTAVAVVLVAPFFLDHLANVRGVSIDGEIDSGDMLEVLRHWVTFAVMLYVVDRLLELLKTLRFGSPFVKENAARFRNVGYALLLGEGSKIAFGVFGSFVDADIDVGLELIPIIAVAAVFVLAEVFREGARMKEEQDLTV